ISGCIVTFRSRHTYARNGTSTELDYIYISCEYESAVVASAIWLNSITTSDHEGAPVTVLQCQCGAGIARALHDVTPIKVVNTRQKTKAVIAEFTCYTVQLLVRGSITLLDDIDVDTSSQSQILQWLEDVIANMYSCLHNSAKQLWGESNQSQHLARAVCIKRSNRCSAQSRQLKTLIKLLDVT
ncbi:hypothetical protein PHMEG_00034536, partial [Phytophthora megakarya]